VAKTEGIRITKKPRFRQALFLTISSPMAAKFLEMPIPFRYSFVRNQRHRSHPPQAQQHRHYYGSQDVRA
jgi:hypothetical protein